VFTVHLRLAADVLELDVPGRRVDLGVAEIAARVDVRRCGRDLDVGSRRGRHTDAHVFPEGAEEARPLFDDDAHFMAVALRMQLDPGLFLELWAPADLDDGLGALCGFEVDVPARDPDRELQRAWRFEGLAPHRALRGRGRFAGRLSIRTSACPKGSG
jgi:hypothetical protein